MTLDSSRRLQYLIITGGTSLGGWLLGVLGVPYRGLDLSYVRDDLE